MVKKNFRTENRVINYYEQTKFISEKREDLIDELNKEKMTLASAEAAMANSEEKLGASKKILKTSSEILNLRNKIVELNSKLIHTVDPNINKKRHHAQLETLNNQWQSRAA